MTTLVICLRDWLGKLSFDDWEVGLLDRAERMITMHNLIHGLLGPKVSHNLKNSMCADD